ncbi:MAG: cupin [Burkholderiaceae bacterium]|nr:cupin [Burkholderiaceae bacterium]
MNLHSDYTQRVVLHQEDLPWVDSPEPGVQRRMLDRIGDEQAKATSIVRYEPNTRFVAHRHDLGEEILVLDGVLSDEYGDYPAGTYLMNPPGSSHAPYSESGCTLFVKLRHLGDEQRERELIDTNTAEWLQGLVPGLTVMPLMRQGSGSTLVRWAPNTYTYPKGSWIRSPHLSMHTPYSKEGCTIFVKTGHLISEV